MRTLLAALCALVIASQAGPARAERLVGDGAAPCEAWLDIRRPGVPAAIAEGGQQWVLGFLSGIASGSVHILGSQDELDATVRDRRSR